MHFELNSSTENRTFFFSVLLTYTTYFFKSLDTVDNGKPYRDAVGDVEESVNVLRYFAGWSDKIFGRTIPIAGKYLVFLTS